MCANRTAIPAGSRAVLAALALLMSLMANATAFGQGTPAEPRRVALVIGNGAYPQSPVASAPGDARAFADVLREGGFDVVYAENARRPEMEAAVGAFTKKLGWGVTAMVYFGGHAIRYQDRNFLLAVDSKIATEADIRAEGIDIDLILDPLIVSRPAGCVVILDAARKNPWQQAISPRSPRTFQPTADIRRDRGLSGGPGGSRRRRAARGKPVCRRIDKVGKGPGIALQGSAQAGSNSRRPGHARPADGLGILAGAAELVISSARKPVRAADSVEQGFWDTIKGSDSAADFKAYLEFLSRWALCRCGARATPADRSRQPAEGRPAPRRLLPRRASRTAASRTAICHPRLSAMSRNCADTARRIRDGIDRDVRFRGSRSSGLDSKAVLHRPARSHVRGVGRMPRRRRLQAKAG